MYGYAMVKIFYLGTRRRTSIVSSVLMDIIFCNTHIMLEYTILGDTQHRFVTESILSDRGRRRRDGMGQ